MVLMFHSNLNDETHASPVRKVSRMHASSIMSFSPQIKTIASLAPLHLQQTTIITLLYYPQLPIRHTENNRKFQ